VSFGRRLALFFVLIAIVPALALVGILLLVSVDSQRGKADARLAAALQTAVTVYADRVASAEPEARRLAAEPALGDAIARGDQVQSDRFTARAARAAGVQAVQLSDSGGTQLATSGPPDAIAFARVDLTRNGQAVGALRVSTTTAAVYVDTVKHLTQRDVVVTRNGVPLAGTVQAPTEQLQPNETSDVSTPEGDFRAHASTLDPTDGESLLLLGPRREGAVLAIDAPAAGILIVFMAVAIGFAFTLARALTQLHDRVAEQAATDPLTGLWNRRRLGERLEQEVDRAQRFRHKISLLILDVDDFKAVNDKEGHLQGDLVLETVGRAVLTATRTIDVGARYGGDELALILPETDRRGATIVAERLREEIGDKEIPRRDGGTMRATISVGVATLPDSASDLDSLVDEADRALLRAKRAGKNQIRTAPSSNAPRTRGAD